MSELVTSAGTIRAATVGVNIPQWGQWRVDLIGEGGTAPPVGSAATATIGDLTLVGTVTRSGDDAPERPHVIVTGGAGWSGTLTSASLTFQSDAAVRLSTALDRLAALAGETIDQPADATMDLHWSSIASRLGETVRYRDVLTELVRAGNIPGWYVGSDGVTHFVARTGVEVATRRTPIRNNAGVGIATYGVDSPASFLPGNTIDGVPILRTIINETASRLTVDTWTGPTIRSRILRLVLNGLPWLTYSYPRTYVVADRDGGGLLDLIPPPDAGHLPELEAVEQWILGGSNVTSVPGTRCLVMFRDADKRRPVVVGFEQSTPVAVTIAGGGERIARKGDAAHAGRLLLDGAVLYYRQTLLVPWVPVLGPATPGTPTNADAGTPLVGDITQGSTIATCGG